MLKYIRRKIIIYIYWHNAYLKRNLIKDYIFLRLWKWNCNNNQSQQQLLIDLVSNTSANDFAEMKDWKFKRMKTLMSLYFFFCVALRSFLFLPTNKDIMGDKRKKALLTISLFAFFIEQLRSAGKLYDGNFLLGKQFYAVFFLPRIYFMLKFLNKLN